MAFVFEGNFDFGAVGLDLAVTENHVLSHDFRYAQLAKMLSGLLYHVLGGVFPALGAGADEFYNVINTRGRGEHSLATCPSGTKPPYA
jgi:hypothetical protein